MRSFHSPRSVRQAMFPVICNGPLGCPASRYVLFYLSAVNAWYSLWFRSTALKLHLYPHILMSHLMFLWPSLTRELLPYSLAALINLCCAAGRRACMGHIKMYAHLILLRFALTFSRLNVSSISFPTAVSQMNVRSHLCYTIVVLIVSSETWALPCNMNETLAFTFGYISRAWSAFCQSLMCSSLQQSEFHYATLRLLDRTFV